MPQDLGQEGEIHIPKVPKCSQEQQQSKPHHQELTHTSQEMPQPLIHLNSTFIIKYITEARGRGQIAPIVPCSIFCQASSPTPTFMPTDPKYRETEKALLKRHYSLSSCSSLHDNIRHFCTTDDSSSIPSPNHRAASLPLF